MSLDGPVTGCELLLACVIQFQILSQDEQVFGLIVAGQGLDDVGRGRVAPTIAILRETLGVMLSPDNGARAGSTCR